MCCDVITVCYFKLTSFVSNNFFNIIQFTIMARKKQRASMSLGSDESPCKPSRASMGLGPRRDPNAMFKQYVFVNNVYNHKGLHKTGNQ